MNTKLHGIAKRALGMATLVFGLHVGLQLMCPGKTAAQTTDEIVAKVLTARGGLEKA
jgi:hypothetical protein